MEKINCNVIQDILPLYIDDVVSDDTKELVEEHLQNCEICQRVYHETKTDLENDMKISAQTKESSNEANDLKEYLEKLQEIFKEKKDKNNPAFHSSNRNLLCGSVHVHE
jgi:predicted anti-sigma-YlaC factor YlaD